MMKKIDVKESVVYKVNSKDDLPYCVLLLGERGYFSDEEDFSDYGTGTLTKVMCWLEGCKRPFVSRDEEVTDNYRYFIPESKVVFVEESKQYRPFENIDEFCNETGCEVLGEDFITVRNKNTRKVYVLLYVGYSDNEVHLGGYILTFGDLLKNYEFLVDEWQPFGVENED